MTIKKAMEEAICAMEQYPTCSDPACKECPKLKKVHDNLVTALYSFDAVQSCVELLTARLNRE